MCSCEVQSAVCGFVAKTIQQSHLFHLQASTLTHVIVVSFTLNIQEKLDQRWEKTKITDSRSESSKDTF